MSSPQFSHFTCNGQAAAFDDERSSAELIGLLLDGPLGRITQMDRSGNFVFDAPIDAAEVGRLQARPLSEVERGHTVVHLAAADRKQLYMSLARFRDRCTVNVTFAATQLGTAAGVAAVSAYCEALWSAMPGRSHAALKSDSEYSDAMLAAGLSFVTPLFFGCFGWQHWLDPVAYAEWYAQEDLLKTPAFRAEARPFDAVFLQAYADPWQYTEPETIARLQVIEEYLRRARKTGASTPAG
ncbi:hypothetical protein [Nannocystis sp. SCPEA4]|uniref:hypothetical protein n=1 Tax=Nannocystis sp. SCPEA4 TaxID=2996787 RepID=UPI00226E7AF7|nr:hypothetical protein [Nannocystis sp. SCPEA4]MCY1057560.1 hypothetical protein [Nannocystis sp. SCPEA4]